MNFAPYQFLRRFLPLVILLVVFPLLSSAQSEIVVGFSDHALISGFADSEIIERELQTDINYRIILGALERVRGEVIPEDSGRLRGMSQRLPTKYLRNLLAGMYTRFIRSS
jgi:hypothetical protein